MPNCLVDPDVDHSEFLSQKMFKARKPHKCCECRKEIPPGAMYEVYVGKQYGKVFGEKTCSVCVEIRDRFCCNWEFGRIWELISDALEWEDDLNLGCLDGLSLAAIAEIESLLEQKWEDLEAIDAD